MRKQEALNQLKTEKQKVLKALDEIVQSGGVVSLRDPLMGKLQALKKKIGLLKSVRSC